MAITIAAATKAPAIPIAIDVFIPAPQEAPGDAADERGYTTVRKALFRRGLSIKGTGPEFKTTRCSCRVPEPCSGCRRLASSAQGVVQFSNQALRTGFHIRRVALPASFCLVKII